MSILFGNTASAELYIRDVFDSNGIASNDAYSRILNEYDSSWWYSSSDTIVCDTANDWVKITSPIITDSDLYDAPNYRLFLSPYRVNKLKNWESIDTSKMIVIESRKTSDSEMSVEFDISASDWFDNNQIYYGFLLPITDYDEIWTPSNELCFQLSNNMCLLGNACDTMGVVANPVEEHWAAETTTTHGAGCVWMDLANVSHTVSNDTITLKWTSLWDWSAVQIAIFDPEEEIYKSLWTAKMDDEKFEYKMQWNGEQNFSLTNWCKEVYYKADAKITTPTEPEKVVTPATWPAENILVIAIVAIVLYGVYAIFFRKSENN